MQGAASAPSLVMGVAVAMASTGTVRPARMAEVKHTPAVIAHRGGSALAPENTLTAFRKAAELGVDYVEMDVRATRDGRLVLMHDRTVDRTTDGSDAVAELDWSEIASLDAGSHFDAECTGERVPSLDQALEACREKLLIYLDHKDGPVGDIVAALHRHEMRDRVVVYGGLDCLREWKRVAPDIPVMLGPDDEHRSAEGLRLILDQLPVEVFDGGANEWTAELVSAAHDLGALVYADNLGPLDRDDWHRRSIRIGVDGIQTDHPDALLRLLDELAENAA